MSGDLCRCNFKLAFHKRDLRQQYLFSLFQCHEGCAKRPRFTVSSGTRPTDGRCPPPLPPRLLLSNQQKQIPQTISYGLLCIILPLRAYIRTTAINEIYYYDLF